MENKIKNNQSHSEKDNFFKSVFNNNQAIMLLVDPGKDQKILEANDSALKFYGYTREQILKLDMGSINTVSEEDRHKLMEKAIELPNSYFQFEHITSSGLYKTVEVNASPVVYKNKKIMFIIVHDITEQKQNENYLVELLAQTKADSETKEILLKEINHRVKNNLSSFIGMLYAEKKQSANGVDNVQMDHVDSLINRVKGIGIAHELLSRSQWAPIPVYKLTERIIHSLNYLIPKDRIIDVKVNSSNIFLDADQSHSTAIIINELFSNSIEHAVKSGEKINVDIDIFEKSGSIFFTYSDSGPGFPDEILKSKFTNVGLYLLKNIAEQSLRGEFRISNDNGAKIEIEFSGGSKLEELY